jgi:3-hydroxyacyl-CoA dehydrogenase
VEKIIDETCRRLGLTRRAIGDQEILERMIFPMINEGARILEETIAARPSDIDVIWLYGYGWPIHRGGPMFHADLVGLKTVVERLEFYAESLTEPALKPTALLVRLAREGASFASLNVTKGDGRRDFAR